MRTHVSIHVKDVGKSVEFYSRVFGTKPQKQTSTYAKFDLKDPPLNFAMQSGGKEISRVSHLGIEVDSPEQLRRWQEGLKEKGLLSYTEEGTDCCFARQDKAWFSDPDGNEWEVFYVFEQLPVREGNACGTDPATKCCA